MKKILSFVLIFATLLTMVMGFSACGKEEEEGGKAASGDWAKIQEKKYFVCGITSYAPMNYLDEDGNLVGFDTEFAKAVAKELGVEVKFQIIDWGSKYLELNSGAIDVIWNGFTFGLESDGKARTDYVDFTHAYLVNRQCIVTKADKVDVYNTKESFNGLKATVESGSSGQGVANDLTGESKVTGSDSQTSALMELSAGKADFAVIDYQMAKAMVGVGDYSDLAINNAFVPEEEVYAIGCRKGSDFVGKLNSTIETLSQNGTLAKIAETYDLSYDLIPNIGVEETSK